MLQCKVCERLFPNQGAYSSHGDCKLTNEIRQKIILIYESGKSLKETSKIAGISKNQTLRVIGKLRSKSEALSISRKMSPILHSESTKEKMRKSRFLFLKRANGNKTPYQRRWAREMSSLESWFYDSVIIQDKLNEKFIISHEHPEYPYFIDFAFHDIRLAVEIDGPLHLKPDRAAHDKKKDEDLLSRGWRIYRIRFDECNENGKKSFLKFLENVQSHRIPVEFGEFNFDKWGFHKKKSATPHRSRKEWNSILEQENYINIHEPRIKKIKENKEKLRIPERGWVGRVAELLEMKPQKVNSWMKRFCPELMT
jgi:very-short-patch-repair endonuclease